MLQIISFLLMLQCLQNVIAIKIWVKPTTLNYVANIKCYGENRELVTIGSAAKMGNRRNANQLYTYIKPDLRKCDQSDPKAFIQITELLSREMKQFQMEKSELFVRNTPFVIGFNIEPSAIKIFHAQPSSPIIKEIQIGCIPFGGRNQKFTFGSAYNKHFDRSFAIPIYETELISDCDGRLNIECILVSNHYVGRIFLPHLFLQYDEFYIDRRTIEPVEVGVNASSEQNEASTSSAQYGYVQKKGELDGISTTNSHLPSAAKVNLPLCKLCEDVQLEIAFIPCGHFISCRQCANKTGDFCPICRRKIEIKQLIYL